MKLYFPSILAYWFSLFSCDMLFTSGGEAMRDYAFGNLVTKLRTELGFSQFQLGKLIGVSDKAVSKWENGVSHS